MKFKNLWEGPVEGLPEGGQFTHDGEVAIRVIAMGPAPGYQDYQYDPVVTVKAGDDIDELRTLVIEWIQNHSQDSLPGIASVDYTVVAVAPIGERLPEMEEFKPESFGGEESQDSSSG